MKTENNYRLQVRSRNVSCNALRGMRVPHRTILRLGSTTPTEDITHFRRVIEINSPEGCYLSSDKILMKQRFMHGKITTAEWFIVNPKDRRFKRVQHYFDKWRSPIIIKHKYSSKGNRIYLVHNMEEFNDFVSSMGRNLKIEDYIFERFYTYTREYRLHVTREGCFYTCRKMLKQDAEVRWHRHENNSVWILEDNELFDRPKSWNKIVTECVNALKALNLDVCAFDIKVQSNNHDDPKFIILESNSAPALGEVGIEKYKVQILKLIENARKA